MERSFQYRDDIRDHYALNVQPRLPQHPRIVESNGEIYGMHRMTSWDHIRIFQRENYELQQTELKSLRTLRQKTRDELVDRGYIPKPDIIDDACIERETFYPLKFTLDHGAVPCAGMDHLWGMVEMPHVPILIDLMRKTRDRAQRVMDLGCGMVAHTKHHFENYIGAKKMTYVTNVEMDLEYLAEHMPKVCGVNPERQFVLEDKNSLTKSFEPDSFGAVIRTGVYTTSEEEMAGIHSVLHENGRLFVSNSLQRQPIGDFLDITEPHFDSIKIHIGLGRYAFVAEK